MLRSLFYVIISVALISCGKEQGVEAKLHRKTNPTPQNVVSSATAMLPSQKRSYETSVSSQSIRQDTYGFRVKSQTNNNGTTDFRIEHFERLANNSCKNTIQDINVQTNKLQNWNSSSTMQMRCFDSNCSYLVLIIEQASSSFTDGTGTLVPAFVPVILEKVTKESGVYYETTLTSTMPFLKLEVDTTCFNSAQIVRYPTQFAVSPIDNNSTGYNYFPDPYNNTWIY